MQPSYVITLGMLAMPVKSYPASREVTTKFRQIHAKCGSLVETQGHRCPTCQTPAPKDEIVKGYDTGAGFVKITKADLEQLEAASSKAMEIQAFVPMESIDPVVFEKANWLGPADPATSKAFVLLRTAMVQTERAAIVQYMGSGKERIGLLRATDEFLVLHELFYPNEVRSYAAQKWGGPLQVALNPKEIDLAVQLVKASEDRFDLTRYEDGYQTRLTALIQARMDGAEPMQYAPTKAPAPVVDLMAALQASLATKKANREAAHGVPVKAGAKVEAPKKRARAS